MRCEAYVRDIISQQTNAILNSIQYYTVKSPMWTVIYLSKYLSKIACSVTSTTKINGRENTCINVLNNENFRNMTSDITESCCSSYDQ